MSATPRFASLVLAATTALALTVPGLHAAEKAAPPAAAAKSSADTEHDALWAIYREKLPEGLTQTNRTYWQWMDKKLSRFAELGIAFADKYPTDPRRWEPIVQMGYTAPLYLQGFKPGFDAEPSRRNIEFDEKAIDAFKKRHAARMLAAIEAGDSDARQRNGAYQWFCIEARMAAAKNGTPVDLTELEPMTERLLQKFPDERGATIAKSYLDLLKSTSKDTQAAFEARLRELPVGKSLLAMKEKEEAETRRIEKLRNDEIGQIKFKATDGTEVDIAKLKGKVVLIDFWATWCGPCIAEIPNVVENYRKYHSKGFEVIGITLESTPDDLKKMTSFAQKNGMVWPQYFDGKGWQNDLGRKFGINAIPAMFLLDKEGRIASSNARGEKLESEIKRLLGL